MSGYIGTQPVPQATQTRDSFTATAGQTSFSCSGYTPNFLDVFLNGVKLAAADYTATNGSDVVLASGAVVNDILEVVAYTAFDTANVTGATNFTVTGAFTSQGIDDNANATALTIDSSERLLIGTTDSNVANNSGSGNDGVNIHPDSIRIARTDGDMLLLNRLNSDGDIAKFLKDGTTVGSIQSRAGAMLSIAFNPSGSDGAGFTGGSNAVLPTNATALSDNAIDLGVGSYRYKNLYLSDSIYLGGTGAANKLDNYEIGSWTPVDGSGQVTITGATGVYTRVGRQVTVIAAFTYPSTSETNYAIIGGLPFAVDNSTDAMYASGSVQTSYISSTNRHLTPLAYKNTSTFYFYDSEMPLTNAAFSTRNFRINITYFTDD